MSSKKIERFGREKHRMPSILELLRKGRTRREIAEEMSLSYSTIQTYIVMMRSCGIVIPERAKQKREKPKPTRAKLDSDEKRAKIRLAKANQSGVYEPTEKQIEAECERIKAGWTVTVGSTRWSGRQNRRMCDDKAVPYDLFEDGGGETEDEE